MPEGRANEVVVIDPSDSAPVGLNPFMFSKNASPELIADTILSVFKQIYNDSWGVYSQDMLSGALLTLARTEKATLLQLPKLLTNEQFRRSITRNISDKEGLGAFWGSFEAMSKPEQRKVIAPVMNKLRQFTLRPALRNMLGQACPKFTLSDLFNMHKIVLVPLNKGIVGAETAKLLGSLIVGLTWTLALARAKLPASERRPVSVFIDELQDYLALPTDFADALAQARGLGVGLTMAHQYRGQLSQSMRTAIDANARNKVVFGLNVADAKDMASMTAELQAEDFMTLPRYQICTYLQNQGRSTGWVSGKTMPSLPALRLPVELKARSQANYGQTADPADPIDETPKPDAIDMHLIGRKKIR